ncbi:MAG: hypothetical protein GBAus27B_000163 [Mycoplasmataceae bacterium]|nr:MAG: hypothetical protein GBAus27B_000163 [Mycoplasmataceae bacterium]
MSSLFRLEGDIIEMQDREDCPFCDNKNNEIKLPPSSAYDYGFGGADFSIKECSKCHSYKDISYRDISGQKAQNARQEVIKKSKQGNKYCQCITERAKSRQYSSSSIF